MRIGASSFIWSSPFGDDQLWLAEHVAELGFDVLEICVEDPARIDAGALARARDGAGVEISVCGAFGPGRDLAAVDATEGVEYVRRCIELAAAVGSPHVAGPMYGVTGKVPARDEVEREAQRGRAVDRLALLADEAAAAGVRLAVEPLNRFETDLVNTVEQGLELCARVGRPNVGLLLDTFHMNIEEASLAASIESAGMQLFHFHACENDRGAPGSGHVDWQSAFSALDRIGYEGQLVIESFAPSVREIARAVSLWRPLAASPDALARDGLAFLRGAVALT